VHYTCYLKARTQAYTIIGKITNPKPFTTTQKMSSTNNNDNKLVDSLYWNQFYFQIKSLAESKDVWHLVNPKGENQDRKLEKTRPKEVPPYEEATDEFSQQDTASTTTTGRTNSRALIEAESQKEHRRWTIHQDKERQYDREMMRYQKQLEGLGTVRKEITNLTGPAWRLHIQQILHPRDALIALEKAIKPNSEKQDHQLENEFFSLKRGQGQKTITSWLDRWTNLATHIQNRPADKIFHISPFKLVTGFYEGINEINPAWATPQLQQHLDTDEEKDRKTLLESIDSYRRWNDLIKPSNNKRTHSVMTATLDGEKQESDKQSKKAKTTCICGYSHDWKKCYYLNKDGKERPDTWNPTEAKIQDLKTTIEKDEKQRKAIERVLGHEFDKYMDIKQTAKIPKDKSDTQNTNDVDPEANFLDKVHDFEVNYGHHQDESSHDDFIIDSGANVHVTHNR
jgi:hypothetical protein